jgi:PAS domain S-box-containing protein
MKVELDPSVNPSIRSSIFAGETEMNKLIQRFQWEQTPLGLPDQWPQSLVLSVNLLLNSKFPMFVWWGPDYISIYNDAYAVILGEKHPNALGKPGYDVWKEIWDVVGPLAEMVMKEGKAMWAEDQQLYVDRRGYTEESYFTFSYSPIFNEQGRVGGVFCAVAETTEKVLATRQIEKSAENLNNIIIQAPVAMCIFKGKDLVVEIANERMLEFWGVEKEVVLHKPIYEALPEAKNQGYEQILEAVFSEGRSYTAFATPVTLTRKGVKETYYTNLSYEPLRQGDGTISGIMAVVADVTAQVINQNKIEESAREVASLVESAPFPIGVYIGKEMRIRLANQSIIDVWGKGPDVIGKLYSEILPELQNQHVFQQLDAVYSTGLPLHAKGSRLDLMVDGKPKTFYFNYSFTPLFDQKGEVYGVMNTAADVTDLTLALQKIKEAEEKALLAIESAALGTYEVNYESNEIRTSKRFNEIWGTDRTNDVQHLISLIIPEDRPSRQAAHDQALKTGSLFYEARIVTHKNQIRWIRVLGTLLFKESNQPRLLIGIVQDITEHKNFADQLTRQVKERTLELELAQNHLQESYQYLQAIINQFDTALAALVPIYDGDDIVDFRYKMTNHSYSFYSKVSPDEIQNRPINSVFPGYQKTDAFEKYVETYRTGKTNRWDLHYNLDGLDVYLAITATKMGNEVVVHFTDFTKLKSLQLDLVRNIEELQRSNKNLEDFAFAASHDLKEPIRKINFFSDKLKREIRETLTSNQLEIFNKLENATSRMRSLVDDLLSYSQVSLKPKQYEQVDLNELFQFVLSDLEIEIDEKKAKIEIAPLPTVQGHSRQLQQLFQNLLGNAIKYRHPDRDITLRIQSTIVRGSDVSMNLTLEQKKKSFYQVTVSDNGIGFEQQQAEIIFHVFQRIQSNNERKGTGVGLSIARKVAENHNGHIWAEGQPGVGARFFVLLPVDQNS